MANAFDYLASKVYLEEIIELEDPMFLGVRRQVRVLCFGGADMMEFNSIHLALQIMAAYNLVLGCGICHNVLE